MSSTAATPLTGLSEDLTALVKKTIGGVVAVKAAPYRVASGVVLSGGLIAVTNHTLRREDRVPIQTADGAQQTATIAGRDPSLDLAVLKVENAELNALPAADPALIEAGSLVAIVGLTIDAGPSISLGVIGAAAGPRRTWRGGTLDSFVRLDANFYPSQSGAAVADTKGRLIGMATPALLRHSALAVPVATLRRVSEELAREGRIRQGYLGVGLQAVEIPADWREKLAISAEWGLIVLSVAPESPAQKAGLQLGDVVISAGDRPTSEIDELQAALRSDTIGQTLRVVALRGGAKLEVEITVAERPKRSA